VNEAFGLTYASYLVWRRVLMESMPLDWQERFVALAEEFNDTFEGYEPERGWSVLPRARGGRYGADPLRNYRRPDLALIERLRVRKNVTTEEGGDCPMADESPNPDAEPQAEEPKAEEPKAEESTPEEPKPVEAGE
jgi:hypothetical protein